MDEAKELARNTNPFTLTRSVDPRNILSLLYYASTFLLCSLRSAVFEQGHPPEGRGG